MIFRLGNFETTPARGHKPEPLTGHSLLLTMKDWLALNMTPGVGPRVTSRLLEHFGSAEAIFDAPRRELALLRLTPETIESLANRELHERAESEIERVRKLGGEILVLDDGIYPTLLRETYDPPVVLYVKGAWYDCLDRPCVAIVGSRLGKLSLSQSRYQRIESGRGRSRSGREFRFADYGAAGDGTEPRSICRAWQHHLAQFFRDELSDKGSRRKAGAAMAGCGGGAAAGDRRATLAPARQEIKKERRVGRSTS